MRNFISKLKRVKAKEVLGLWKLPAAILPAAVYRLFNRDLWIVCEDPSEARDNGYWFFKYVRENYPGQNCVYAIKNTSADIRKVRETGKTVEYGSLTHWILYLASDKKISSQKAGNPNAAAFYFLEVYGLLKDKRIFLQHGIIKDDMKWLYYDATKMSRFICGAYPEYKFVESLYGYPKDCVRYTGLCRFDGLHNCSVDEKLILIMPTWREWIADEDERLLEYEGTRDFTKTNYFIKWTEFINDSRLNELADRYGVRFVFFPHRNMQKYLKYFPKTQTHIHVAGAEEYDVQYLLKRAALMVTDYSSVFFDFIYMKKPLVFYQFDYQVFRKGQYSEGYFDYKNNPFSESFESREDVFGQIEKYIRNNYAVSNEYLTAHAEYFKLYDTKNCERVYKVVKEL